LLTKEDVAMVVVKSIHISIKGQKTLADQGGGGAPGAPPP